MGSGGRAVVGATAAVVLRRAAALRVRHRPRRRPARRRRPHPGAPLFLFLFFFFFFLSFFFGDQVSMRSITVSPHLQKKEPRKKKGSSKRDDPWEKSIKIEGNGEIVLEIEIHREIDVKKSKFIEKC